MKKILIILVAALMICFLYFYKSPVISTDVALNNAEKYLLNPPEEWANSISFNSLEELTDENISVYLEQQYGLWNEITNRMQWEVTIKSSEIESTIVMDAHTGKFIDLIGGFN
ncbi:hypothetical protein [Solibacillus sp. FSL H8-0538]|uniref:hypothetical protein n=1 Tax=Solibacillus sp. FSL H8-0538 TaxID=2921400 RepID=UPI0030F9303B